MTLKLNIQKIRFFIVLIALLIPILIFRNPIFSLLFNLIIFGLILIESKISFFSELSFIIWFSYLQGVIQKTTGLGGGTLKWAGVKMPFYFHELTIVTTSFMLTVLFFVWFTPIIRNEKKLYQIGTSINLFTGTLFLIIAIVLIILVFPSIPTFKMNDDIRRYQGISNLYGFTLVSLFLAAITIDLSFLYKRFWIGYLFIVLWIFGHAERVEVLGFLSYFLIKYLNNLDLHGLRKSIINQRKRMLYIGSGLVLFLAMWIGMSRQSYGKFNILEILYNLIVQPTCGDVVYVFNCAVDMWKSGNAVHGYTYIDYIMQLIPGSSNKYQPAKILIQQYNTMGGGLFFTEPMMNFGLIGTILMNIEFCVVYSLILKKVNSYKAIFWIPIVIEIFRTSWYGRSGWILACFVETPLLYFGIKFITNRIKTPK